VPFSGNLSGNSRLKHPNQYTYRTKAGSRTRLSPSKQSGKRGRTPNDFSTGTTPVLAAQTLPPLPSHTTAQGHSSKSRQHREPAAPVEVNGWGLPDHLKHLQYLLPSAAPIPLDVPSSTGSAEIPDSGHLEPPTRIRFPTKRITMSEMKKRAKHILEYMTRIQIEMSEQERRNEIVAAAAAASTSTSTHKSTTSSSTSSDLGLVPGESNGQVDVAAVLEAVAAENLEMMDQLTKVSLLVYFLPTFNHILRSRPFTDEVSCPSSQDVIIFQQRFFAD
jgi:hypothetical protein